MKTRKGSDTRAAIRDLIRAVHKLTKSNQELRLEVQGWRLQQQPPVLTSTRDIGIEAMNTSGTRIPR